MAHVADEEPRVSAERRDAEPPPERPFGCSGAVRLAGTPHVGPVPHGVGVGRGRHQLVRVQQQQQQQQQLRERAFSRSNRPDNGRFLVSVWSRPMKPHASG